jgi:hypothetical protein
VRCRTRPPCELTYLPTAVQSITHNGPCERRRFPTTDLKFSADKAVWSKAAARQSICELLGNLAIRGTARPFKVVLKVSEEGDTFRAVGDGTVTLSAHGIERPSQLGVTTADDVKLRFDLTGKAGPRVVATTGAR